MNHWRDSNHIEQETETVNLQALETKLAEYAGDFPALEAKIVGGIKALQASKLETFLESRWPGLKAAEQTSLDDLAFLSNLDGELIGWLDLLFPKAA